MLSYSLVKLLSLFVYPLAQVLLLLFLGLYLSIRGHSRPALVSFSTASLWLWLCSMPYVAGALMSHLETNYPPVAARNLPRADAIVLLGGAIRGKASPETLADMSGVGDRLVFAVAAFNAGKAPVVLVTGGAREGEVPEASLIRDILVTMGIPRDKIVLETRNRVTRDNGRFIPETLAGMGVESVLLVTSAFHMRRAMLVFEPLELTIYPAPSDYQVLMRDGGPSLADFFPSVKALQRTTWAFHEQVGYWYYKLVA
jgi:uncharacterized SAM-binding protein YcdF (DUF218 family)